MKLGDVQAAINTCVYLNQWNIAIELAETHRFKEIESVLKKYGEHILEQGRQKEAVLLYRKANFCQNSAKILFDIAKMAAVENKNPQAIKKLFVLGALEIERFRKVQKVGKNNV
jgi:WD repeat-containing protein 35